MTLNSIDRAEKIKKAEAWIGMNSAINGTIPNSTTDSSG
jgi:hypothetical protein